MFLSGLRPNNGTQKDWKNRFKIVGASYAYTSTNYMKSFYTLPTNSYQQQNIISK